MSFFSRSIHIDRDPIPVRERYIGALFVAPRSLLPLLLAALLIIPLLAAFSCDLFPGEKGEAGDPGAVSADIVWSRETGSGDLQPMAIRDGVLYYAESPTTINGFTALDPVNGDHFFLYNADLSFDKYVTACGSWTRGRGNSWEWTTTSGGTSGRS